MWNYSLISLVTIWLHILIIWAPKSKIFYELLFQRDENTTRVYSQTLGFWTTWKTSPFPQLANGDPAYPFGIHLQAPYHQGRLTQQIEDYNKEMSEARVSVERLFEDIINSFKFLDYKKNLKIGLSSVSKMYIVCALLRNAITCLFATCTYP